MTFHRWFLLLTFVAAKAFAAPDAVVAVYDFSAGEGDRIREVSAGDKDLDLVIANPGKVKWGEGFLEIGKGAEISTAGSARRLTDALKKSGELSVEVWIESKDLKAKGPARIVTLSKDSQGRNFTLGQDGTKFDARLRTTKTDANGLPSLASKEGVVRGEKQHLVFVREKGGRTRLFVNGHRVAEGKAEGDFGNWDSGFRLALGDELTNDRPWEGRVYGLVIHSRALSENEVALQAEVGPAGGGKLEEERAEVTRARHFERVVAPILAEHCMECHDPAVREGKLDLSRHETAMKGGLEGEAIVPGKPDHSLLWEMVSIDEMPEDRTPLNAEEKAALKKWIQDGAVWSLDRIDPADYKHDRGAEVSWVQRLTRAEYVATVRDTLGVDLSAEAAELLPPDVRADGFDNTAYNLTVDLDHVGAYARLAELAVAKMDVKTFGKQFEKGTKFIDDDMRPLVEKMGARVLRGPLDKDEVDAWLGITSAVAAAGGTYEEAVGLVLEGMLQSPRFVYRVERQAAGSVEDHALASRLSYILWGTSPDETLRKAASDGKLRNREQVAAQAERMLKEERAVDRSRQFLRGWLNLGRLANLNPDKKHFPNWKPELAAQMERETLEFFEEIAWRQKRPLADLLNAQVGFFTPELATHYGLKSDGEGWQKIDLSQEPSRGGLLTQGSVLTIGGDEASMVTRGLFVLDNLLRGVVNDPPPCVDTTPVPSIPGRTQRDAAQVRIADISCGGCHKRFEPLAFGLERYNGLGSFQTKDQFGNELREDGELLVPGEAKPTAFATASELMDLMTGSERVTESLNRKVIQFALGRPIVSRDVPALRKIHAETLKNGGGYAALMKALVTSDLVLKNPEKLKP